MVPRGRLMGAFDWVRKAADYAMARDIPHQPLTETKGAYSSGVTFTGPDTSRLYLVGDTMPDAETLTRQIAFATSALAYTAMMYRAEKLAEPPVIIVDAEDKTVDGHPLAELLRWPDQSLHMGDLVTLTELYRLSCGHALWDKGTERPENPERLLPFSGDEFTVESYEGRIWGRFRLSVYDEGRGQRSTNRSPEEVVYFRDPNPGHWYDGLGRLEVALATLDLGHQINKTVRNFMRKAMFPGGVISPDPAWNPSPEDWDAFRNAISAWHSGPANAGVPIALQGGTQYNATTLNLRDMLPTEMLDRIEAVVASVFRVPPILLGWKIGLENAPWSNIKTARLMFIEDTLEPRWTDYAKAMTRQLLPEADRRRGLRFAFDRKAVRGYNADDAERATVAAQMASTWTLNERRIYTGMDPIDDESGDEIQPAVAAPMMQLSGPGHETKGAKALTLAVFEYSTKAAEQGWEDQVAAGLDVLREEVLKLFDEHVGTRKANDPELDDDITTFLGALAAFLRGDGLDFLKSLFRPLVASTGDTAVRSLSSSIGQTFTLLQDGLEAFVGTRTDFLAGKIGETTAAKIGATMRRELQAGGLVPDIRKALEEDPTFDRTRAQLVARTETTASWNGAQRDSMAAYQRDNPSAKVYKTWLSAGDARVRDEHEALDGTRLLIDELFANGLKQPGEPNCRCTLTYEVER